MASREPDGAGWSRGAARLYAWLTRAVRVCAPLVPNGLRDDWRAEWDSELWHRIDEEDRGAGLTTRAFIALAWRTAGALPHALSLFHAEWRFDMLMQDLTYAIRTALTKRRAFTMLVVGMLGIGIGANTAMFTVVNSVLLQPLPYQHAEELIATNGSFSKSAEASISPPDFLDYREGSHSFTSFAGYQTDQATLSGSGEPERLFLWRVTANFFSTLGVAPIRGRTFLPEEEEGPGHDVAMLSYALWERRFGGDTGTIGKTISLNGRPTVVVGILPPVLDRTIGADIWRPFEFHSPGTTVRRFHGMRGIARLRPGVTIEQARADVDAVAKRLEATYPENATWSLRLRPYHELIIGDASRALTILLGAVGLVLLIACGNVASLLLAAATARRGEIGIRAALGASRTRLVRQLLTESMVLSLAGGAVGLALAVLFVKGVRTFGSGLIPRLAEVTIDPMVLAFTALLAIGTGLLFGLAPAFHAARTDLTTTFAALGRGSGGRQSLRWRDGLVVAQVALSLMLLVGAGLLLRSLWQLESVPSGFDSRHVFTAAISLPEQRYPNRAAQQQFWHSIIEGVRASPGVTAVSATTMLPMTGGGDTYFWRTDQPPATNADRRNALISLVADDFFGTMRIRVVSGRAFGAAEQAAGANAVILNQRLAGNLYAKGENPIGHELTVDFGTPVTVQIVGVVDDVRSFGPANNPPPTLYFPVQQSTGFGAGYFSIVARTSSDPLAITGAVRTALKALDPDIPLLRVRSMDDVTRTVTANTRTATQLLGGFAVMALLLALVGLYGVLSYAVAQRTREMGIRIAFGAQRHQLFGMVTRRGMLIVAAGVGVGLAGAAATTQLLRTMLFNVGRIDPVVFGGVTVVLAMAGLVACLVPARRATKIDPVVALRGE